MGALKAPIFIIHSEKIQISSPALHHAVIRHPLNARHCVLMYLLDFQYY